jgi:RNA polymerase sigma-70 factor (ECF subfamily)
MSDSKSDKAEFSQLVEQCMAPLYQLALKLTHNHTEAEDLVAESVARAWKSYTSLEDKGRFRPWIFRILHNGFISNYRKQRIRPQEVDYDEAKAETGSDRDVVSLLLHQPDDFLLWWSNPERAFANNLMAEDIASAIDKIPEAYRLTVLLVNVEGFTYDEAAEILGIPPGTVRSRMKRGRTLLQRYLWQHARDAGLIDSEQTLECPV